MIGQKFGLDNVLSRCHVDDSSLKIDRPREFRDVWLMGSRCPHIYPLRDPGTGSSIFFLIAQHLQSILKLDGFLLLLLL